jgi:hypothetical protein
MWAVSPAGQLGVRDKAEAGTLSLSSATVYRRTM